MGDRVLEKEHKYDVDVDLVLPDLDGVKGIAEITEPLEHVLEATCFDTVRSTTRKPSPPGTR